MFYPRDFSAVLAGQPSKAALETRVYRMRGYHSSAPVHGRFCLLASDKKSVFSECDKTRDIVFSHTVNHQDWLRPRAGWHPR